MGSLMKSSDDALGTPVFGTLSTSGAPVSDASTSDAPLVLSSPSMPPKIPLAPMKRIQARFNPLADGMLYLVVFLGGAIGTGVRYALSLLMPTPIASSGFWSAFHAATFIANMLACCIFAALSTYMTQASWVRKRARQLSTRGVGMGFCGGFSTLSAMAIEELTSLRDGQIAGFAFYLLASFICGLIVAGLGVKLALMLSSRRSALVVQEAIAGVSTGVNAGVRASDRAGVNAGVSAGVNAGNDDEPAPVTGEIAMVADPMRGEAREEGQR